MSEFQINTLFQQIKSRFQNEQEYEQFQSYLQQYHDMQKSETTRQSIISHIVSEFMSTNMIFYNKTTKVYFNLEQLGPNVPETVPKLTQVWVKLG